MLTVSSPCRRWSDAEWWALYVIALVHAHDFSDELLARLIDAVERQLAFFREDS